MLRIGLAAVTTATGVISGVALAGPAVAQVPAAAGWHVTKTVAGPNFQEFTSATAASGTSAWAFESGGAITKPRAYRLSGHAWSARAFPGQAGEQVFATSSSSPADVWAFTLTEHSTSRVLRYNGHSWKQVKTFGQLVGTGLAISSNDVWVFGEPFKPELGTMHFNGHRWIKVGGGLLLGASALSASSIWAYGPASVAHWNGSSWHRTSVTRLLPKGSQVCGAGFLSGIVALSAKNVYAVGAGGCPDGQGPLVLLHFDGKSWQRVAIKTLHADPEAIVSDGSGGVWLPLVTGAPPSSTMYHFSRGTLTRVRLPVSPAHLQFFGATIGQHTTAAIAFGLSRKSFSASTSRALIMQFGS